MKHDLNRKEAYWFARGYYDGRAFGSKESQEFVDAWSEEIRLAYKQGYDIGVADHCEMDIEEDAAIELQAEAEWKYELTLDR